MRVKNTYYNITTNITSMLIITILTLINRRIFLDNLNNVLFGLNSLCVDILVMLSLVELGIGQAMVYALYKPVAENDQITIKSYMKLYMIMYRYVALVILVAGFVLMLFLPYLIKDDVSFTLAISVFSLYLFNSVISYFLSYKRSILYANQKAYIMTMSDLLFKCFGIIAQIVILIFTKNLILYVFAVIVSTILSNLFISWFVSKKYEYLRNLSFATQIEKDKRKAVIKNIKALAIHNIGNFFGKYADNIVIALFLSLNDVGIFSNYMFILVSIGVVVAKIFDSATASIGSLITENDSLRTNLIFDQVFFISFIIALFATSLLCVGLQPFIEIWIGIEYLLDSSIIYLMSAYLYIQLIRTGIYSFKTASGIFDQDKIYPILLSVSNLLLSLLLVFHIGIIGIFISKILTNILFVNWVHAYYTYRDCLKRNIRDYVKVMSKYISATTFVAIVSIFFCNLFFHETSIANIIFRVTFVLGFGILTISLLFSKNVAYKNTIILIKDLCKKILLKLV